MKICEEEFVLSRLGVPYLNESQGRVRKMDNVVLAWAFLSVTGLLAAGLCRHSFLFLDSALSLLCFVQFLNRRKQLNWTEKKERGFCEKKKKKKQTVTYVIEMALLLLGLFGIALVCEAGEEKFLISGNRTGAMVVAIMLLLAKESFFRYFAKQKAPNLKLGAEYFRFGQLPTVFALLSCLLEGRSQSIMICLVSASYMVFCGIAVTFSIENKHF